MLKQRFPNAYIHMIGFSRGGIQGLLTYQDYQSIVTSSVEMHIRCMKNVHKRMVRMVGHPSKNKESYDQEMR